MPKKDITKKEPVKKETPKKEETVVKEPVSKAKYYTGVGRRKSAVARAQLLLEGDKSITVNGISVEKYFSSMVAKQLFFEPLKTTNNLARFTIKIKVEGSGNMGQLGAAIHAMSRALLEVDPKYRAVLRKKGLLTRDPRVRERRKVGRGGKARRAKQSPKR